MPRPTSRLAIFASAAIVFTALSTFYKPFLWAAWAYDVLIALAFAVDSLRAFRISKSFTLSRNIQENVGLGAECDVVVTVASTHSRPVYMSVRDEPDHSLVPGGCVLFDLKFRTSRRGSSLKYTVKPTVKGDIPFGSMFAKIDGPWRLASITRAFETKQSIAVFPGLADIGKFDMLVRRGRLQQVGIKSARLRGGGSDFESLRDYVLGDEYRKMDWSATARRGKLITRQYEAERSQNIILCLDTGRTMLQKVGVGNKLDYVIDTTLMLANIARAAGDNVGLLTFDAEVRAFVAPGKGAQQMALILKNTYKLEARLAETEYLAAFEHVRTRWRKRSLVILFTDLIDPESSFHVANAVPILMRRYRVLCVTVADPHVHQATLESPEVLHDVYRQSAALQVLSDRKQAIGVLRSLGVWVLDCAPDQLTADLVNRYLDIKERGLI